MWDVVELRDEVNFSIFSPHLTNLTHFLSLFCFHTIFNRSIFPFFIRHKQQSQKLSGISRRRRRVRTHPHPAFAQKKRRKFFVLFNIQCYCKVCVRLRREWREYRNLRRCSTNVGSLIMTFGFNSSEPCRAESWKKEEKKNEPSSERLLLLRMELKLAALISL